MTTPLAVNVRLLPTLNVLPFMVQVPVWLNIKFPVNVKLSANVNVILDATFKLPVNVVPLDVAVIDVTKTKLFAPDTVYPPVPKFKTVPLTRKLFINESAPVKPVRTKFAQFEEGVMVTVPEPLLALKKTLSTLVGTLAPDAPPDVADQFVVEL